MQCILKRGGRSLTEAFKQHHAARKVVTWGAGRVQADVELVSSARHFAKQALQCAHLVLLKRLIQVAADQAHCTGLDDWPPGDGLHLLHAGLRSMLGRDYDRATGMVVGLRGAGWGLQQLPAHGSWQECGLRVIPVVQDRVIVRPNQLSKVEDAAISTARAQQHALNMTRVIQALDIRNAKVELFQAQLILLQLRKA